MKSNQGIICLFLTLFCLSCASNPEWRETTKADTQQSLYNYSSYWIDNDFSIQVTTLANKVVVRIDNPKILLLDSKEKEYASAAKVTLHSGILAANQSESTVFREAIIENGVLEFTLNNYANQKKVPIVEHLWGEGLTKDGKYGALALDPQNKWIIYELEPNGKINLDSLAIGIVMYPDKPAIPLKALKKGKIVPGRHRELESLYVEQGAEKEYKPQKYTIKRVIGRADKSGNFEMDEMQAQINGLAQAATQISGITVNPKYLPLQLQAIKAIINDKIERSGWMIDRYRKLKAPKTYTYHDDREVVEIPMEIIFNRYFKSEN